ncbi:prolyl aminopeptidase-like protein [Xylariaceae sp. FL0016]|nr:prolyl aminopeptidase-like protein [Xylariaceae sp. FL0016]
MASSFPFHIKEHAIPGQHIREWPRALAHSQEDALQIHIKQYIPHDNPSPQPGDVTFIGAHANGFPKELYEALWTELHSVARSHGFRIRSIWIADVSNQGRSGVLNEELLGHDTCWHDHARDLLHMVNIFRDDMPRPLVGVGHSFGGNVLTHLSLLHPRLFSTLVLLDPVIVKFSLARVGPGNSPTRGSTFRRETWPNRSEAAAAFRRSPFYSAWDPRVLDAWVTHALRDTPTPLFPDTSAGDVTLSTTKHQEVFTFFRPLWPHVRPDGSVDKDAQAGAPDFDVDQAALVDPINPFPFYRGEGPSVLRHLPEVRPSVLWVFGGTSDLSTPELRQIKMSTTGIGQGGSGGAAAGRVAEIVMEGMGHLFPMEVPAQVAKHLGSWVGTEMVRWRQQEAEYVAWTRKPMHEKNTLSQEFVDKVTSSIGGAPRSKAKKDAKL